MSTKKTATRGRKGTVLPLLKKSAFLLKSKTNSEFVRHIMPSARPLMKGGENGDLKKQMSSLSVLVSTFRKKGIAEGKTGYEFAGRMIETSKGKILKKGYIHAPKVKG